MTLQILTSPKYIIDPQMQMLLKMTNHVVSNIVQMALQYPDDPQIDALLKMTNYLVGQQLKEGLLK